MTTTTAHHATRRLIDAREHQTNAVLIVDRWIKRAADRGDHGEANDLRSAKSQMASAFEAMGDAADMLRDGGGEA